MACENGGTEVICPPDGGGQPKCGLDSANPKHNQCHVGDAENENEETHKWTWDCKNDNGTANCVEDCGTDYTSKEACENNLPPHQQCQTKPLPRNPSCWERVDGTSECKCKHYGCKAGTSPTNSQSEESHGWEWQCVNGSKTVDCTEPKPTTCCNGQPECGPNSTNPTHYNCRKSEAQSSGGAEDAYIWECHCDGNKVDCVECKPGYFKTEALCNADSNKPTNSTCKAYSGGCYKWECDSGYVWNESTRTCDFSPACECADNNTADATCGGNSSPNAINKTCCKEGYFHPHPPDTIDEWKWTCENSSDSVECSASRLQCSCDPSTYATFQEGAAWADTPTWRVNPNGGCSSGCHKINSNAPEESRLERNRHAPSDEDSFEHVDVHRWTCTGTDYQNSERCEWVRRFCQGAHDDCLLGCPFGKPGGTRRSMDCSVDDQNWPGFACLTSSATSDCVYSVCDRRRIAGCRCQAHACHQPASP